MAIYHLSVKIIGRSAGRSAVAAAAYRSGSKLHENKTGKTYDYTHKGGVIYSEIDLPKNAPAEFKNREILWNSVQSVEQNRNAQLAREVEFAIPREIEKQTDQIALAHDYIQHTFVNAGMCADWALHDKGDGNVHVHCMLTMRPLNSKGEWQKKESRKYKLDDQGNRMPVIDPDTGEQKIGARGRKLWVREKGKKSGWDRKENIEIWRKAWSDTCNKYLDDDHKIDHRSYKRRGIDKMPTIHLGYAAIKRAKLGLPTDRISINTEVAQYNDLTQKIKTINNNLQFMKKEIQQKKFQDFTQILSEIINDAKVAKDTSAKDITRRFERAGIIVYDYDDGTTRFEYRDIMHEPLIAVVKTDKYNKIISQIVNENIRDIENLRLIEKEHADEKAANARTDDISYASLMHDMARDKDVEEAKIEETYQKNADALANAVDNEMEQYLREKAEEQRLLEETTRMNNALNNALEERYQQRKKEDEKKAKEKAERKEQQQKKAEEKPQTAQVQQPKKPKKTIITHTQYWGVRQAGHYRDIKIVIKLPTGRIIDRIYSDRQYDQILRYYPGVAKKYGIDQKLVDKIRDRDKGQDKGRTR